MTGRPERRAGGFTLIEIAVVLAIVGTLAAIASTAYDAYLERVRVLRAVIEIKNMATTLEGYLTETGSLPPTLADAGLGAPKDPWGNPYQYLPLAGRRLPGAGGAGGGGAGGGGGGGAGAGGGAGGGGGGKGGAGGGAGGAGGGAGGAAAGGGGGAGAAGGGGGGGPSQPRKDRFLVPINTDFDLYSMGRDGESVPALTAAKSRDDVVRAANGSFIGLASKF
jgi:general secretion pathway protein G